MRALTTQETTVLKAPVGRASTVRVRIKDAGGAWRNLSELEGRDFLDAVELDENVDQPVASATVTVMRQIDMLSLAPLRADSKLNTYGGAQLIRPGREFLVEAACVPLGSSVSSGDWRAVFHGDVDEVDFAGEQIVFRGRDLGGRLQDSFIETERIYGDDSAGVDVEVVMQSILNDNATGVSLYVPLSPGWKLKVFEQKKSSVLDALRDLAQQIGWELRYSWRDSAAAFALTLREPVRTSPSISWIFGASDYRDVSGLSINRADIRNKIEVVYSDYSDLDPVGKPKVKSYIAQDSASQAAYRTRFMQIAEGASSNIDSPAEAKRMADAALADLKEPLAEQELDLDFFWPVQLGDYLTFRANGVHYSDDQNLAVTGFRHSFSIEGDAKTTLTTRGSPSYGVSVWLEMDVRPGMNEPRHNAPPLDLLTVTVSEIVNGFSGKLAPSQSGPPPACYELHVSPTDGFAPTSSTLRGTFDTTAFEVSDLTPGIPYFLRVVPRDAYGNRGNASAQISVIPKKLGGGSLEDSAVGWQHMLYPPTDNLIPNGYNEAGIKALGKNPDGSWLVEDPTNAREGRWVRRIQFPAAGAQVSLNWVGGYDSPAPGGRIKCSPGDQFFAEGYVKASSALAGSWGVLYLLWEDSVGLYSGFNVGTALQPVTGSYQRVTVKGTCPAGCTGVQLYWVGTTVAGDVGKFIYWDAVSLRKMVTFDLIAANTLRTTNYTEDGNGVPTAGVKLDNTGLSMKVASNNVQVGRYYLSDGFFRSVQALADTGTRVFYRGNNNGGVSGGAPNIDRLSVQVSEGYAIAGASGGAGWFTWAQYRAYVSPQSPDDNLDGLRFMSVVYYWSPGDNNAPTYLYDTWVPIGDRKYQNGNVDSDSSNMTATNFTFVYGDRLNRLRNDGLTNKMLYLKIALHNVHGSSAERWFYPPTGYNVSMVRSATGPGGSGTSTGGGGGSAGTCVAPWEPVMLHDGTELPAEMLRPGMRVLTMLENGAEGGTYKVVHVGRHASARVKVVTVDGRVVVVTPNHRWRTAGRGWMRSDELKHGDVIEGFAPGRVARVEPFDSGEVIKISVDVARTFIVKGLLAHNLKPRD
jgi:hypothetical protein